MALRRVDVTELCALCWGSERVPGDRGMSNWESLHLAGRSGLRDA